MLTPEQREKLNSQCSTEEQIQEVVEIIRGEILPKFTNITMSGDKILIKEIKIKEAVVTKTGLVVIAGQEKPQEKSSLAFDKHPYQGVVIAVGCNSDTVTVGVNNMKAGDHVLCKRIIEEGNFKGNTVLIAGEVFGFMYQQDIVCSI